MCFIHCEIQLINFVFYVIIEVKLLADALEAESVGRTGKLDLFLPPITCPFLQYNGVLVDTPGIDLDKDLDSYIQDSCKEADVFVLVVNSETILRDTVAYCIMTISTFTLYIENKTYLFFIIIFE